MEVTTERFIRKPLYVDAVRVTSQNFEVVAAWCDGEIQKETEGPRTGKSYIRVRVQYPKSPRQSKAFVGDWVLYTETGYKVYTNPSFRKSFDAAPIKEERPATADEIREKLPNVQDKRPHVIEDARPESISAVAEEPSQETGVQPIQEVRPGDDLGETPQGEQIEVAEATPQAIADVVNEQQPEVVSEEELAGGPVGLDEADAEHKIETAGQPEPVSEQAPEDAAGGKRVLSEEEQAQMGPDAVREMVSTGDVVLAQDLAA